MLLHKPYTIDSFSRVNGYDFCLLQTPWLSRQIYRQPLLRSMRSSPSVSNRLRGCASHFYSFCSFPQRLYNQYRKGGWNFLLHLQAFRNRHPIMKLNSILAMCGTIRVQRESLINFARLQLCPPAALCSYFSILVQCALEEEMRLTALPLFDPSFFFFLASDIRSDWSCNITWPLIKGNRGHN